MRVRVQVLGSKPEVEPCPAEQGWYAIDMLHDQATVADLLPLFGFDREALSVIRNGLVAEWADRLYDGDEVCFIPPILGG